jgi:hypothetical protein
MSNAARAIEIASRGAVISRAVCLGYGPREELSATARSSLGRLQARTIARSDE